MPPHEHALRVYYEDTDFSGFVYHAGYLKFLERARTELLRSLAIVQSDLHRDHDGLAFVVARIAVDYLKPARMDDWLVVATTRLDTRGASMRLAQTITRDGIGLVRAEVTIAAVRRGRPVRLPNSLRAAIEP